MSFLKDVLGFERFNLKDMGKKLSAKRLLLGAVDPFSTRMWNQTHMGKDWEPIVDQMGGAYGGSALTLGDTGEGVYGRAKAAGVPTEAGAGMHDIAHVITSLFAGGYGAGKLGGMAGNAPPWLQKAYSGFTGMPGGNPGMGQQIVDPMQQQQTMQMMAALLQKQRMNPFLPQNKRVRAGNYSAGGNYYG
jgi:hypothetical protein